MNIGTLFCILDIDRSDRSCMFCRLFDHLIQLYRYQTRYYVLLYSNILDIRPFNQLRPLYHLQILMANLDRRLFLKSLVLSSYLYPYRNYLQIQILYLVRCMLGIEWLVCSICDISDLHQVSSVLIACTRIDRLVRHIIVIIWSCVIPHIINRYLYFS